MIRQFLEENGFSPAFCRDFVIRACKRLAGSHAAAARQPRRMSTACRAGTARTEPNQAGLAHPDDVAWNHRVGGELLPAASLALHEASPCEYLARLTRCAEQRTNKNPLPPRKSDPTRALARRHQLEDQRRIPLASPLAALPILAHNY